MMQNKLSTVSEIIFKVKQSLETEFSSIIVKGEVSNLSTSSAGHVYFTLSDKNSSLSVALFRGDALRNPIVKKIKDGDEVICSGPISVYARRGSFQLIAKQIVPEGQGALKLQFEQLKNKLNQEGVFDISHKKKIPLFPKRVAVITAFDSAAMNDFVKTFKNRALFYNLLLIPAVVQGDKSAASLIRAIDNAEAMDDVEVIVLTRGGGSMEDLWSFNDESLVYRIFQCKIPIISGVGHEVDTTLCDYVSDLRVETPTAAANFLTESQVNIKGRIRHFSSFLLQYGKAAYSDIRDRLSSGHPNRLTQHLYELLSQMRNRLSRLNITDRHHQLLGIHEIQMNLDDMSNRLNFAMSEKLKQSQNRLSHAFGVLNALNPNHVLKRGYSYIQVNDHVMASVKDYDNLTENEVFEIIFHDGKGKAKKIK